MTTEAGANSNINTELIQKRKRLMMGRCVPSEGGVRLTLMIKLR